MKLWILILCISTGIALCLAARQKSVTVGDRAPLFMLYDAQGNLFSLKDAIAQSRFVILMFYPKDHTSGCTAELCAVQKLYPNAPQDITIVGISSDSAQSHQQFAAAHQLQFPLLIDTQSSVRTRYGAYTWWYIPDRVTIVIDHQGIIVAKHEGIRSVAHHVALIREILAVR
jgi:peroxiredoxin Q/BCP